MDYELAKQLKDAGFPFKTYSPDPTKLIFVEDGKDFGVEPTLSELIEACLRPGWFDFHLGNHDLGAEWGASLVQNSKDMSLLDSTLIEHGKTREEAVAKLWLALNTSKVAKAAGEPPAQFQRP